MSCRLLKAPLAAAAVAALAGFGCVSVPRQSDAERRDLADAVIQVWPTPSRLLALKLIETRGLPDRIELDRLTWAGSGEWESTAVWRTPPFLDGCGNDGVLEQTVRYRVPEDRAPDLVWLGGQVRVLRQGRGLASCASDEGLNRLALNLADEILRGVRDPRDARSLYEQTAALRAGGKSSPYLERLLFSENR